jgi:nitrogen regulatory protein P-II 1
MKEIKAFIHRNRAADVVRALRKSEFTTISVVDVKGVIRALEAKDQEYSTELGARVMTEVKLELFCDVDRLNEAIKLIQENAQTGQPDSGSIYVSDVSLSVAI